MPQQKVNLIHYPFCPRGAFEYDKFALNILQYHNMIRHLDDRAFVAEESAVEHLANQAAVIAQMVEDCKTMSAAVEVLYSARLKREVSQ